MTSTRNDRHGLISHTTNLIMLIEDDIDHAELIIRTTQDHPIPNQVRHFLDANLHWIIFSAATTLVIRPPALVRR